MPVTHRIEGDLLQIVAAGHYPPNALVEELVEAFADPLCPEHVKLLLDVRASEALATRNPDQIRRAAEFLERFAERIGRRCAVVVARDVQFGLARMGSVFSDGVGVDSQVFRSVDEAVAWLQKPRPSGSRAQERRAPAF